MCADALCGTHGPYHWFQSASLSFRELLVHVPDLLRQRHVAVTASDGGPLPLNESELASGWSVAGDVAISPLIEHIDEVPFDEYDEWYVFVARPQLEQPSVFVNYGGFSLRDPAYILDQLEPTWDRALAEHHHRVQLGRQEQFWSQLLQFDPESFLSAGDNLICATRCTALIDPLRSFFVAGADRGT